MYNTEYPPISRLRLYERRDASSAALIREATGIAALDEAARFRIRQRALLLAAVAREGTLREGFALSLVHRFGLDTPQGIALMQLAEALPRTVDAASAHLLIADKVGSLTWRDALGVQPTFAQRAALHALDTLAKVFRDPRSDSSVQKAACAMLEKAIAGLGTQYVLGESLPAARANARKLSRSGYSFSYDMLGEAAMTDGAAREFLRNYLEAVDQLSAQPDTGGAISVKLSALHPRFDERQRDRCLPLLIERALSIALRARAAQIPLTLDAEEADRLEISMDVFEALLAAPGLQGWNGLGIAVQAYQRRALAVIDWLSELSARQQSRINVRLVKGAYWDTEIKRAQQLGLEDYPIFLRKRETDIHYIACARRLLAQPARFFAQVATHNAQTVATIVELAEQTGNRHFEFQRLYGMGTHLHDALLQSGFASRIYAPVGPRHELLPYLVRRLLENGASSSFVRQLTDTELPIEALVHDPFEKEDETARAPVREPTDVHGQVWPAAAGYDLTARDTNAALLTMLQVNQSTVRAGSIINGTEYAQTESAVTVNNPSNCSQVVGFVAHATVIQCRAAVSAAHAAHREWSTKSAGSRAAVLVRAADLLEARAPQFIALAVKEAGKTIDDAVGEVREAVDFCRYYAEQCQLPLIQSRKSLGVIACISPWNFPLAIFLGQVTAALAAGNTVIAKPAEQTPLIATLAVRLLHEAGVPVGALHLTLGDGRIGGSLIGCEEIAGICFTGSTATARTIGESLANSGRGALPFIAETGGINAMIVDSSSLPEQVVRDVLTSAFQSAGQRCSALRVLCLQEEIADRILMMLRGALAELRIGDPAHLDSDIGPLIDADAHDAVRSYLGAHTALAQAPLADEVAARGYFVAPTILEVANVSAVRREVFGPVLHVTRFAARDLDALVREINSLGYGLTLGVHSRIRRRVQRVIDLASIGNVYVNRHQVGAVVGQQPFGGHGLSGTGPKAGGPHYLLRLTCLEQRPDMPIGPITLSGISLDAAMHPLLAQVRSAQAHWERTLRRSEIIRFACQLLTANTAHPLSALADRIHLPGTTDVRTPLANIAGEENLLQLKPRGVLLCLSASDASCESPAAQILLNVALGNGVLLAVRQELAPLMRELLALLRQSGVPENLVVCVEQGDDCIPGSWLTGLDINGVVFDGSAADAHAIAAHLWRRTGAILPLLSSTDDCYRFCLEQTVTINSAAAGGDPRLLGMTG